MDIFCPKSYESSVIVLTISTFWKCYDNKKTTYELPIFCMPCDSKDCRKGSATWFANRSDWRNKITSTAQNVSTTSSPKPVVPTASPPISAKTLSLSNANAVPINKSDPAIQVPGSTSTTYLDFSFNSIVPVLLPNGQIAQVLMCAPNVESISNTGRVSIVFSKPIEPISPSFYEEIADSGVV